MRELTWHRGHFRFTVIIFQITHVIELSRQLLENISYGHMRYVSGNCKLEQKSLEKKWRRYYMTLINDDLILYVTMEIIL